MPYGGGGGGGGLSELIALGRLAGGTLGLPSRVQAATQQQDVQRQLLEQASQVPDSGISPEDVNQYAPPVGLQFLNPDAISKAGYPGSGTIGKIVGGVGDIGEVISALFGGPVGAPRVPLSELTALSALKANAGDRQAREDLAGSFTNPRAKIMARLKGGLGPATRLEQGPTPSRGSSSELGTIERAKRATDPAERQTLQDTLNEFRSGRREAAVTQADELSRVLGARGQVSADTEIQKTVRLDAAKKLQQIGDIEERVLPMMERAEGALTTNPAIAATVQPALVWARALGGDDGALAIQQLQTQIPALARLSDTGNLSEPEQAVWRSFLKGDNMTAQQFALSKVALQKVLASIARRAHHTFTTGEIELPKSLQGEHPNQGPAGSGAPDPLGDVQILNVAPRR